jgi:hypothetical protein
MSSGGYSKTTAPGPGNLSGPTAVDKPSDGRPTELDRMKDTAKKVRGGVGRIIRRVLFKGERSRRRIKSHGGGSELVRM